MKKQDIILIAAILIIAIGALLFVNLDKKPGAEVVVRVDGDEIARYSLYDNGTYELNGGTNILVIEDGVCWLKDAHCPDKYCVNQGKISKTYEVITCKPNKLTVTVYGAEESIELVG